VDYAHKTRGTSSLEIKKLMNSAMAYAVRWIRGMKLNTKYAHGAKLSKRKTDPQADALITSLTKVPKNLKDAFQTGESIGWKEAAELEMSTLTEMGVFDHGYTMDELIKAGCTKDPINISVVLTNKFNDGIFDRHKVRMAVAGHKYNMTKGVDYDEVFAPSPNQNTARALCAMAVAMGLQRMAWDIKLAYCWADLPDDRLVALKYPKGYERDREIPGSGGRREPEYIILRKNCYGLPAAGKTWADHRDKYMNERFNSHDEKLQCQQCIYDPCLFYITRGDRIRTDDQVTNDLRPYAEEAWISIHTDDCDAYGTSKKLLTDIYNIHNSKWKAKEVPSNFMLGIKRHEHKTYKKLGQQNVIDEHTIEMTMTSYVDGVYEGWKSFISPNHKPSTPFPQNLTLSKQHEIDPEETQRVLDRGYMCVVGQLLWATRGVYPECHNGCNQLGSLLARPTEEAWTAAMHMVKWLHLNRLRGIKFDRSAVLSPVIFSDASNKPDIHDGLSRYGFSVMMAGAPIASTSKKLAHVGLSAFHNEYMALRYAASHAMWIRNLLREVGCSHLVREPTRIYGDNQAANKLTKAHFISTGNQYIYLPYFWIQELVRKGEIVVPYVNTKLNVADLHTKSVTTDVIRNLLLKMCGYDTTWLHELMMNTSGYTTPIKPKSKHVVVTAYTRVGYTPPVTRTRGDMKMVIASYGSIIYTSELSEFKEVDDTQLCNA
jgi:hypothetical protein